MRLHLNSIHLAWRWRRRWSRRWAVSVCCRGARLDALTPKRISRCNLSSCDISLVGLSTRPSGGSSGLTSIHSLSLCYAALEIGALLNSERLVANIADDMRPRLKHHVAGLNWTFHSTVHNDPLGSHTSNDLGIRRDDKRSATDVALYPTVDLN